MEIEYVKYRKFIRRFREFRESAKEGVVYEIVGSKGETVGYFTLKYERRPKITEGTQAAA